MGINQQITQLVERLAPGWFVQSVRKTKAGRSIRAVKSFGDGVNFLSMDATHSEELLRMAIDGNSDAINFIAAGLVAAEKSCMAAMAAPPVPVKHSAWGRMIASIFGRA